MPECVVSRDPEQPADDRGTPSIVPARFVDHRHEHVLRDGLRVVYAPGTEIAQYGGGKLGVSLGKQA